MNGPNVYQVRLEADKKPADIVSEITHAVWNSLLRDEELKSRDPHRWPSLYKNFQDVFKKRLVRYDGCGEYAQCAACLHGVWSCRPAEKGRVEGVYYTLETKGTMENLIGILSILAYRRYRDICDLKPSESRRFKDRVAKVIRQSLADYVYFNDLCSICPVRRGYPDRRIWN